MQEFKIIKRDQLSESFNLRRRIDAIKDAELAESIRQKGILQPLLVRPRDGRFEIIFGHRRFRAAEEAGVEDIPIRIKEMNDQEVLEIQMVENLQRADMHPLDEAEGYQKMLGWQYDVPAIAAKIGRSKAYVYARLKLTDLISEAKKVFLEDKITAGHAILLARLQPADQKEGLKYTTSRSYDGDTLSVRNLMRWIENNIHLDLHASPFKKTDCTACTKRTGSLPDLFPDIKKKDTCTDPKCYQSKLDAHIQTKIKEIKETDGSILQLSSEYSGLNKKDILMANDFHVLTKKDMCEHAKKGIIVEGRERGKVLTVCADKTCKKHFHRGCSIGLTPAEKKAQQAEAEKERLGKAVREKIFQSIVEKVPANFKAGPLKDDMIFLCGSFFRRTYYDHQKTMCKLHGLEMKKDKGGYQSPVDIFKKEIDSADLPGLQKILMELALLSVIGKPYDEPDYLIETAERYGIDHDAIKKELTAAAKGEAIEEGKEDKERSADVCG